MHTMSLWKLASASLKHYWRLNLAVLAGVLLTAAVLGGALVVGDSVKESLRRRAFERIAGIHWAVVGNDRFFTETLAEKAGAGLGTTVAGIVQVLGSVSSQDGEIRANSVQVLGVDDAFWKLSDAGEKPEGLDDNFLAINGALAQRLGVQEGDLLVARVEIPSAISRDAPLSGSTDATVTIRKKVDRIIGSEALGGYSLRNEQASPLNLYTSKAELQRLFEKPDRINVALLGGSGKDIEPWQVNDVLAEHWTLADALLRLKPIHGDGKWELSSERVFMDRKITEAVRAIASPVDGVLTYFVKGIRSKDIETPYSMVTATEGGTHSLFPGGFEEDGIIITGWLAEDLGVAVGDVLTLRYDVVLTGRELREETAEFKVAGILPMENPLVNVEWTPYIPGLSDAVSCRDWEPGFPVELQSLRDKDQKYWDDYRGTPKAFIGLRAGQQLWSNRFGDHTALHLLSEQWDEAKLEAALRERVGPADFGLGLRHVRGEARAAAEESLDFGALFASMSFFLIAAALILTGLLFAFGVEQRSDQIGLCLALGMEKAQVRRWFLMEALVVSVIGAVLGAAVGVLYTRLALWGLSGIWSQAVSGMEFIYHARAQSLAIAVVVTVILAMLVVAVASRAVMRIQPRELITKSHGLGTVGSKPLSKCLSLWIGLVSLLGGVGLLFAPMPGSQAKQGAFFGAGALLLTAGICACILWWRVMARRGDRWSGTLRDLGLSFALRRRGRSLAIITMMAAGVFLVVATNAMRLNANADAEDARSGTGGFQYVGASTLPVYETLTGETAREEYGLKAAAEDPFTLVQMRVSGGDDASCLNLNRAQKPRLLGVDPAVLSARGSFSFVSVAKDLVEGEASPWTLLDAPADDAVPAIIDQATAVYALGKKLGDVIEYEDGRGDVFRVRLSAFLSNSLLQGNILISEKVFAEKFPDAGGFQMFLLDAPSVEGGERVTGILTRMLGDRGLEFVPAAQRLNEFNAVQNTYLSIFSVLGGMGVLLGTVGLAILVGRNVLERRGQLGLMRATGFGIRDLAKLVLAEHWFLHVLGVLLGTTAALVAISGKFTERDSEVPLGLIAVIVAAILVGGLLFCWWAARVVVRFPLLESLRSE